MRLLEPQHTDPARVHELRCAKLLERTAARLALAPTFETWRRREPALVAASPAVAFDCDELEALFDLPLAFMDHSVRP